MKNKAQKIIAICVVMLELWLPLTVVAVGQNDTGSVAERGQNDQALPENFLVKTCEMLEQQAGRIADRLAQPRRNLEEARSRQDERLAEHRSRLYNQVELIRTRYDERHNERIKLMLAKVADEETRQALLQFQQSVQTAVAARRAAFDVAQDDYGIAMDAVTNELRIAVNAAADVLQSAIDVALEAAKTACADSADSDSPDIKTIRAELQIELKAAREQFQSARKDMAPLSDSIKPLTEVRNAAFRAAKKDFDTALEAAHSELKLSLDRLKSVDEAETDSNNVEDSPEI
ncbi:hypothetical protein KKF05_03100 [Patescibacteria group bacterium]|nr:hypothetical protein [Patescibacteria group bacterium]MBU1029392.1 hypothetical protein [Patescibacteria group bacterium]